MPGKVGEAVKPSPSADIVRTWHGCVEVFLRLAVLLSAAATLVASSIALSKLNNINDTVRLVIAAALQGLDRADTLIKNSTVAAGLGIGVGGVVVLMEVLGILQRFCNIRAVSRTLRCFLALDVILSFLWSVGLFAAGILAAYYTGDQWSDLSSNQFVGGLFGIVGETYEAMAATAGIALFSGLLTSLLMVWIISTLIKSW